MILFISVVSIVGDHGPKTLAQESEGTLEVMYGATESRTGLGQSLARLLIGPEFLGKRLRFHIWEEEPVSPSGDTGKIKRFVPSIQNSAWRAVSPQCNSRPFPEAPRVSVATPGLEPRCPALHAQGSSHPTLRLPHPGASREKWQLRGWRAGKMKVRYGAFVQAHVCGPDRCWRDSGSASQRRRQVTVRMVCLGRAKSQDGLYKINQVETPTTVVVPDFASLPNRWHSPGTWYQCGHLSGKCLLHP